MIDLRSDTVTKPTPGMLDAMLSANVGDDVFDEDPTINALQEKAAEMFGKEAALFCPSGTMTNQIAIRIQTQPQDEVICDRTAHIYNHEAGGMMYNSMVSVRMVEGDRGRICAQDVIDNINPDNIHYPGTRLVSLENTVNKGGGSCYDFESVKEIYSVCREHNLNLHLDGARLFNAMVETGEKPEEWGNLFDTVSICLSKGLGAPVGSLLISTSDMISRAKRVRKVFGGGMRQAGFLAAAGIYALDHHINRLKEDHVRAKVIADTLKNQAYIDEVLPVDTNIIIFKLKGDLTSDRFLSLLQEKGIKAVPFGSKEVRFVTHLDYDDKMLDETVKILNCIRL
ncbi:threonine aldolase family protein [Bacteroidota bacterium]